MNVNRGKEKSNILPGGWRWEELAEVCDFVRGVTFNKAQIRTNPASGFTSVLRAGNIQDALNTCDDLIWVPEAMIDKEQYLRAGDVAICLSSGSASVVGKTAYCEEDTKSSVGAFCGILRARGALDNRYLSFWLRSKDYKAWRDLQARGTNIQNLRFSEISKIHLPLPPLSEQKRIAAILIEQMVAVEKARAAADAQLEAAKALPAGYLRQIFPKEGRKLPQGWRWVGLGEVVRLVNGNAYRDSDWSKKGIPIVRIQNLNDASKPFNYWDGPLYDRVIVKNCDVLFAWSGTPGTSFGAHLWMRGDGVLNQHIFRVDLDTNSITSHWCVYAINQQLDDMISKAHGGVGLRHVTKNKVEALRLFLPPLPEQKRIAAVLDDQMSCTEKLRNDLKKQLHEINALPAALLKRAFNGEL